MECVIPKSFGKIKEEVSKLSRINEPVVSLTTDIWSYNSTDTSLLYLITHWIDDLFTKVSAVSHTQALEMVHTGEYIHI